jgi:hypothetical protein
MGILAHVTTGYQRSFRAKVSGAAGRRQVFPVASRYALLGAATPAIRY